MKRPHIQPRPTQQTPGDLVDELLAFIRHQFCAEIDRDAWFRRNRPFLLQRVILWPARFMTQKGFVLPPERYKQIMYTILRTVQQSGDTAKVSYWPAYLAKCVQSHWQKRWHLYYEESKTLSAAVPAVLSGLARLPIAPEPNKVEQMAAAQRLLTVRLRRCKTPEKQLPLL